MNNNEDLRLWFGTSRASFAVLPRVLMEAMPEEWQRKMSVLLNEADDAYPGLDSPDFRVQSVRDGRLVKTPRELLNYRHPDQAFIARCRGLPSNREVQPAATEPAAQAGRGPLGCAGVVGCEPSNGETK